MRANDRHRAWVVVALLFIFMVINFADKAVIGIAAVPIMQELELGPRQFGLVGSSFFLLFAVSSVATGFLVNRVQTRWVLLAMGFICALTQFPMIGSVGFETLVACRLALGAGEGPAAPVAPAFRLQMVSQRTAHPSDRCHCARRGDRRPGRTAAAQLGHCALELAFGLRRTRFRQPRLVRIVARLRREGLLDNGSVKAKDAAQSSLRVGYAQLLLSPTV